MKNSVLSVKNLVFSGVHGSTGREYHDPQRFRVDLEITLDISRAALSDCLRDTFDYRQAIRATRQIVEGEHYVLIETMATKIAEQIFHDPKIQSVTVRIQKLDASSNGLPGIAVRRRRLPEELEEKLLDFDIQNLVTTLDREGGVSIPLLSEPYRRALLAEAETYEYVPQPEVVGPYKVREQLSSTYQLRPDSLFFRLRDDFEQLLERKGKVLARYPFATPLRLDELALQKYEVGSIGVTPHLDMASRLNLICVVVLTGRARVALCDDREGSNPRDLDATPGNVIILRAPGFLGSDARPFHFVSDVTERRIVFCLRQIKI